MFEKFLSGDVRDFATRYQGTYGFYSHPGKPRKLVRLSVVDEAAVRFIDASDMEYSLFPDVADDIGFEFLPPRTGFFNTDEGAYYVERVAARQFSRGISERTTKIYKIGAGMGYYPLAISFKSLSAVYESKLSPALAYQKFIAGAIPSFCISEQFAFDGARIYVYGSPHGTVEKFDKDSITLKLEDPKLFQTEIRDNFRGVAKVEFA